MGGSNPYIQSQKISQPKQSYKIKFVPGDIEVTVDSTSMPTSGTGLSGSILDIALASGVEIDHACGGVCACATCHVVVLEGLESCNEGTDDEQDQLDRAPGVSPNSRLACQTVPNGSQNLVVEIPSWNRNLVREGS